MMLQPVLDNLKITALNQMQEAAFAATKKGNDILVLAPTGSGKTLAFLLPVLNNLSKDNKGVQCLVLVPSRELALQIEQVFKQMGTGFKVNCCYGGHPIKTERNNLEQPPALLIGTLVGSLITFAIKTSTNRPLLLWYWTNLTKRWSLVSLRICRTSSGSCYH